jgi:Raf kinase inhibitor-like YbhB/YbcL family protein
MKTNRHPWRRLGFVAVGWIAATVVSAMAKEELTMKLTSVAWMEGQPIPENSTCDGADVSPPLAWSGVPAGTQSFALICDDPDAPGGTWVHWVIYGVPATATAFSEAIATVEILPDGGKQGVNDFRRVGYGGPCPPPGGPHRYYFKLYALDATLTLKPRATKAELLRAMAGHVLAEAHLMGTYRRAR